MGDITLKQLYTFIGCVVAVAGTFAGFWKLLTSAMKKISKPLVDLNVHIKELDRKMTESNQRLSEGLQNSLRIAIVDKCKECLARESITNEELHTLIDAYNAYKNLLADGYIDNLYNRTIVLPVID